MKTVSFEYLLPEYARTIIYKRMTKKDHPLKKTLEMEIEKRLNLALDRQTYRVTQSRAAETFNGTIPKRGWKDAEGVTLGLLFGLSDTALDENEETKQRLDFFMFLVGWSDVDYVMLASKYQNLISQAHGALHDAKKNTDAIKRAEVRLQYAAENYGRWLEKVMY